MKDGGEVQQRVAVVDIVVVAVVVAAVAVGGGGGVSVVVVTANCVNHRPSSRKVNGGDYGH